MPGQDKILVVDDDPEIHNLLRHALSPLQCEIISAYDLPEAVERLEETPCDLVILDLLLPGPNGMELLLYIRERELPVDVILLTAHTSLETATDALRLGVYDYITKPFDPTALRTTVARALEQRRLRTRLSAFHNLGQRLASALDTVQVAEALLETIAGGLKCDLCCLWMVDLARRRLHRLASRCPPDAPKPPQSLSLDTEVGIIAAAARTGETIYIPDAREDSRRFPVENVRSAFAVPLLVEGEVRAVLGVGSTRENAFGQEDRRFLDSLANQAAIAIERARLFEEARQRACELDLLNKAAQTFTATLDLREVLTRILRETCKLLNAGAASVLLYDSETNRLTFTASSGPASDDLVGISIPADSGIAGWVLQRKTPALVPDAQADPRFFKQIDALTGLTSRSLLAVPLICKGETIGVLEVVHEEANAFSEQQLSLLTSLAGSAAIAIANAQLHERTSHLLAEARVLQEITLAAASTLDFDQVLTRTLQAIRRTLRIDYLVFALPDESGEHLVIHPSLVGFVAPSEEYLQLPLEESVCGRVYTSGQPELVEDLAEGSHYFKETPGLRSLLAVPVQVEGRVIAVLGAGSVHPGALTRSDLRMFEAIAAQLGIVMENARLYEAERELRKLVEQSRTQLVRNERLAATGRLAASLAHEINNPLQAIHNSLQLILTFPMEPDEQREYLQIAAEEVKQLMKLVARMLDFARRPRRNMRPTQVNDLVERTLALCNKYLQHHRVAVQRNLAPDLPLVQASPDELSQVFLNLILNAVDAMPNGGSLSIATWLDENGRVAISFTDTGHGVPQENLERIFEPFFTTKEGGTGLGLSVSRDVIQRHRGEITVQSIEGEGATFTVFLPALGVKGD
ncbi:MAG TPA: GAF domain-containing protein [Chloroflexi bacterium]|nr:GAF domain-containing protein [Chloroflexota bacterium]